MRLLDNVAVFDKPAVFTLDNSAGGLYCLSQRDQDVLLNLLRYAEFDARWYDTDFEQTADLIEVHDYVDELEAKLMTDCTSTIAEMFQQLFDQVTQEFANVKAQLQDAQDTYLIPGEVGQPELFPPDPSPEPDACDVAWALYLSFFEYYEHIYDFDDVYDVVDFIDDVTKVLPLPIKVLLALFALLLGSGSYALLQALRNTAWEEETVCQAQAMLKAQVSIEDTAEWMAGRFSLVTPIPLDFLLDDIVAYARLTFIPEQECPCWEECLLVIPQQAPPRGYIISGEPPDAIWGTDYVYEDLWNIVLWGHCNWSDFGSICAPEVWWTCSEYTGTQPPAVDTFRIFDSVNNLVYSSHTPPVEVRGRILVIISPTQPTCRIQIYEYEP